MRSDGRVGLLHNKPVQGLRLTKLFHWNYAEPADNRPKSLSAGRPKSDFDGNQ